MKASYCSADKLISIPRIILFVLLISSCLFGCVLTDSGNNYQEIQQDAQNLKVEADMKSVQSALEMYYYDYGEYPDDINVLVDERYVPSIPFGINQVTYEITGDDYYTLTTILPNGELLTVGPY